MKLTADTNVLVRVIVADEPKQARAAQEALANAELVAIASVAFCELVWVLARGYGVAQAEIATAIRTLVASATVETDRPAIEAGLTMLEAGGDFADGIIAFEGARLGGDIFASFDKDAVKLLKRQGQAALLLG